ncbi:MAG: winged helix DNA-binding domain-containing protein [Myxococcaceae bacterium]|nr:winged helix DNA-binding domain-containing protein [Myxococcaceae bacterium]
MMTQLDIARRRLANQRLTEPTFKAPSEVVRWLGAVQAQDYGGAKWAIAQRGQGLTDASLERAFAAGSLLRTHVLRPTWHFVTPSDLRWMLALTAPRVHQANAYMVRKLELDDAIFRRSNAALAKALEGGRQLMRTELARVLERANIKTKEPLRLGYLLMRAELDGVICSGVRRGNQFTYALFDDRVPKATSMVRDEALHELALRYFTSRGPATLHDFTWWSGLTMADAKKGAELSKATLERATVQGQVLYWSEASPATTNPAPARSDRTAHLLPNYDEYFIGFKDRRAILNRSMSAADLAARSSAFLAHVIAIDGQLVGGWKRTLKKTAVVIELEPVARLTKADHRAITRACAKFGTFLGLPAEVEGLELES